MAPKSTQCTCTTSALALFIRRMAHIDFAPPCRATNITKFLHIAKRNLTTRPPQSQRTSKHDSFNTTIHTTALLSDSIPFDQAPSISTFDSSGAGSWPLKLFPMRNIVSKRWTLDNLAKQHNLSAWEGLPTNVTYDTGKADFNRDVPALSQTIHQDGKGPSFLELNTETIDKLAAKSSEESVSTKRGIANAIQEIRPNRLQASRKGFTLQNSSPAASISTARDIKHRDPMSSESQVPPSRTVRHRLSHVTEQEPWQTQKAALKEKFKDGWNPRKRLSPDALAGIRAIHAQFPEQYTTSVLAEKFEVSPEAIRRILKSRWTPKEEEVLDRQRRWFLRGQKVWSRYAELGLKPPARWRELGIGRRGNFAARRGEQQGIGTTITMRHTSNTVQELDENFASHQANMAERIL